MTAGSEEKQVWFPEIGNTGSAGQGGLTITPLHSSSYVSVSLVDFKGPRRDPGMAGSKALQILLSCGGVSRQGFEKCDRLQLFIIQLLLPSERESGGTLPQHDGQGSKCLKEWLSGLALFCTPQLQDRRAVTDKRAIEVAFRLLELCLEAGRRGGSPLGILLERSMGHVWLFLIGVDNGQLEVFSIIGEVRLQFEYLAIGSNGFVIAACHEEHVTTSVERIGVTRT